MHGVPADLARGHSPPSDGATRFSEGSVSPTDSEARVFASRGRRGSASIAVKPSDACGIVSVHSRIRHASPRSSSVSCSARASSRVLEAKGTMRLSSSSRARTRAVRVRSSAARRGGRSVGTLAIGSIALAEQTAGQAHESLSAPRRASSAVARDLKVLARCETFRKAPNQGSGRDARQLVSGAPACKAPTSIGARLRDGRSAGASPSPPIDEPPRRRLCESRRPRSPGLAPWTARG
jgi:hypothetical protein